MRSALALSLVLAASALFAPRAFANSNCTILMTEFEAGPAGSFGPSGIELLKERGYNVKIIKDGFIGEQAIMALTTRTCSAIGDFNICSENLRLSQSTANGEKEIANVDAANVANAIAKLPACK